jgi:hypothetical protein
LYKVDPRVCVLARNLFSKNDWRSVEVDEVIKSGPKMPLVSKPASRARRAERLTRTRSCPNFTSIGPSGQSECVGPDSDAGEEVALRVFDEVIGVNILD